MHVHTYICRVKEEARCRPSIIQLSLFLHFLSLAELEARYFSESDWLESSVLSITCLPLIDRSTGFQACVMPGFPEDHGESSSGGPVCTRSILPMGPSPSSPSSSLVSRLINRFTVKVTISYKDQWCKPNALIYIALPPPALSIIQSRMMFSVTN